VDELTSEVSNVGALDGLRVIDFGQYLAAPLAAMWLGDSGAEVIRIDPPGGPTWKSPANAVLQRGKKSIVLDLKEKGDLGIAHRLVASADIVLEGFRPGVMDRLGLGHEEALRSNPQLIYCSIPGFGSEDPRAGLAGFEGVVSAAAGFYPRQNASVWNRGGEPGTDPVFLSTPVASSYGAIVAAHSIVAALIARERSGRGQWIESPIFDAMFELYGSTTMKLLDDPPPPRPEMTFAGGHRPPHMSHYRCADGKWLMLVLVQADRHLPWLAKIFPQEWIDDGMADPDKVRSDPDLQLRARARYREMFASKTSIEWERILNEELGVPAATCQTSEDWLVHDEHARESGAVIELDDPEYGHIAEAGYAVTLSKTPMAAHPRHNLDSDRDEVLAELDRGARPSGPQTPPEPNLTRALAGFKVVDLCQVLAGPTMARVLAQYGADVVKINSFEDTQLSAHFYTNAGKRSVLLNLKTPKGKAILARLVKEADVFGQNFAGGVPARLGVAEDDIRAIRPDIVYTSISTFGSAGRRAGYRGREELGQGVTGMQHRWRGFDNEPDMGHLAFTDFGTGHVAAFGVLIALYHRLHTNEGQSVHASLAQTGTFLQVPYEVAYFGRIWDEPNGQEVKGFGPLDRLYQGSDETWFYLAAVKDGDFERLSAVEGLSAVARKQGEHLEAILEDTFRTASTAEWVERLQGAGIAAHALMELDDVMTTEGIQKRGLSVEEVFPVVGRVRTGAPARHRLSLTPPELGHLVGPPGYDTRDVLTSLGLGDEIDELVASGVVRDSLPLETTGSVRVG